MGAEPDPAGMHARWRRMQARRRDEFASDFEAMASAWRAAHPTVDGERMLASLREDVRAIEAGRAARAAKNAGKTQAAYAVYQAARARFAAERDQEPEPDRPPSVMVAAAMGLDPARVQIF
jgi:hypothetical protein